jgi:putative hydrolase of the HAD superfamily
MCGVSFTPLTPWLLFDYGEVLCLAPSPEERNDFERALSDVVAPHELWPRYWAERLEYDRGTVSTLHYWHRVLGIEVSEERVDGIHRADIAMWSHPNQATLDYVDRARQVGYRLALLSNAPAPFGDAFDQLAWLEEFEPRLFSGRLGLVKPDDAIFHECLAFMNASPDEVTFIDDREDNVETARRLGLSAVHFHHPSQLEVLVDGAT